MGNVVGIAIDDWTPEKRQKAADWLYNMYGPITSRTWYFDVQPMCEDLVMRKDIYFMFVAAFGESNGTPR